jgi:hypothetical protein
MAAAAAAAAAAKQQQQQQQQPPPSTRPCAADPEATLAFCRALPKIELHAHINGCIRDATLNELCRSCDDPEVQKFIVSPRQLLLLLLPAPAPAPAPERRAAGWLPVIVRTPRRTSAH